MTDAAFEIPARSRYLSLRYHSLLPSGKDRVKPGMVGDAERRSTQKIKPVDAGRGDTCLLIVKLDR